MTNCINCGAILRGDKCEYCGTKYNSSGISANFNTDDYTGIMKLGNEEIKVYIGSMQGKLIEIDPLMDSKRHLHPGKIIMKRIFTVVEI